MTDTDTHPHASRWSSGRTTAAAVLLLTAIAGVLLGVVLDRRVLLPHRFHVLHGYGWYQRGFGVHPMFRRTPTAADAHRASDHLARALNLTATQRVQIDSIMARRVTAFRDVRRETQTRIAALLEETRRAIDSVLTPEQRARFQAMHRHHPPEGAPPMGPPRGEPPGPVL